MKLGPKLTAMFALLVVACRASAPPEQDGKTVLTEHRARSDPKKQDEELDSDHYQWECDLIDLTDENKEEFVLDAYDTFKNDLEFRNNFAKFERQYLLERYATQGKLERVQELVKAGAELDYSLNLDSHAPALAWAARCNHVDVIKYLIAQGANVNVRFIYTEPARVFHANATPLLWAEQNGHKAAARALRAAGARRIKERVENIPWDYANPQPAKKP